MPSRNARVKPVIKTEPLNGGTHRVLRSTTRALSGPPKTTAQVTDPSSPPTPNASAPVSRPKAQAKASPLRKLYGEFVHVKVGPEREDIGIHKGLLCSQSKFFHASFNGPFTEAATGIVDLPEDNPSLFEIVNTWLYTKQLTRPKDGEDIPCTNGQLADLYILGDKYGMPALCKSVIDIVIERFEKQKRPMAAPIARIYSNLPASSPLRKLVLATYTQRRIKKASLDKNADALLACPHFLLDLTKALYACRSPPPKPRQIADPCQYHQHAEGEARCAKTKRQRDGMKDRGEKRART